MNKSQHKNGREFSEGPIGSVTFVDGILTISCSGDAGVGSLGHSFGLKLREQIERGIEDYPDQIELIRIDFSQVQYTWGNEPVTALIPSFKLKIRSEFIANKQNYEALKSLVASTFAQLTTVVRMNNPSLD